MLRFSANLSMLFQEYDFLYRFEKAAACGFRAVEFMFPYDYAPVLFAQRWWGIYVLLPPRWPRKVFYC